MKNGNGKKTRVLITDDHSMLVDGLREIIEMQPGLVVAGATPNGDECVKLARELAPDVILMDISLQGKSGIEATRVIKKERPAVKVLMVSSYDDDFHIMESFQAGADGFIPKHLHAKEIIKAIHEVMEKGNYVPQAIVSKLVHSVRALPEMTVRSAVTHGLTPAELRVLNAIRDGRGTKQVAVDLDLKEKTVRNQLNSIFDKLGVNGRLQAVDVAIKKGIISRDG